MQQKKRILFVFPGQVDAALLLSVRTHPLAHSDIQNPRFHIVTPATSLPSSKPPYKTSTAAGVEIKKAAGAIFGCVRVCVRAYILVSVPVNL